ncbi:MAG: HIT family protein [bacterium]|nr:HIT family protein [bacterium]
MTEKKSVLCPFCVEFPVNEVIAENARFKAKYDQYPVSAGHALLIPKRHISSFFELNEEEILDFFELIRSVHKIILRKYSPQGFNIGINIGNAAGQTISHLHIHLIPRYTGDVDHPEGGVRNIVPNLVPYPKSTDIGM